MNLAGDPGYAHGLKPHREIRPRWIWKTDDKGRRVGIMGNLFGRKWPMFASCLDDKFACGAYSDPGILFDEKRPNVNYWEPWYIDSQAGRPRKPGTDAKRWSLDLRSVARQSGTLRGHVVASTPPRSRTGYRPQVGLAVPKTAVPSVTLAGRILASIPTWTRTRARPGEARWSWTLGESRAVRYTIGMSCRAADWACTSICRFTKPVPRCSATPARRLTGRTRTGTRLGSQPSALPIKLRPTSAKAEGVGVEPT